MGEDQVTDDERHTGADRKPVPLAQSLTGRTSPPVGHPIQRSLRKHLDRGFRPDIEGLRAVAVVAVVLYHIGIPGIRGGFVGVDVFFVVSGFLITRLMLGELAGTGTLSLRAFWARRARRLLPAAALVAAVTAIAAHWMLDPLSQRSLVTDVVASGTFTANIVFADRLGGYFGAQLGATNPSPLLHYWSLALEEQFYLCWPPLLALLTRRPREYRRLLLSAIGVIGVGGFAVGLWLTHSSPSWAFYLLPARMGELLGGALLAVLGTQVTRIGGGARTVMGWAGLAGMVAAAFVIDGATPWPGVAVLLPVVATMAVIVSGTTAADARSVGHQVLSWRSLQWIGRRSYGIYLWHWPVLILSEAQWGPLTWSGRYLVVCASVGLAAVSLRLVEDPIRHSRFLTALPARSLAVGGAMCLVVLAFAWNLNRSIPSLTGGESADAPTLEAGPLVPAAASPDVTTTIRRGPTTDGSASTAPAVATTLAVPDPPSPEVAQLIALTQRNLEASTAPTPVATNLNPSLGSARERSLPYDQGCVNIGRNYALQPCVYAGGSRTILLYGDSKAVQWFEPLEQIALERGYRLVLLIKAGCPVADVEVPTPVLKYTCPPYRDAVVRWIERNQPEVVIVANSYVYEATDIEWNDGVESTIARIAEVAAQVVVIGDNPSSTVDPPACLSDHLTDATECATSRADAVRPRRLSAEVASARRHRVQFVDTTDWFCTADTCPVVIGNLLVYRDEDHITSPMALFLQPLIEAALAPAFDSG